MLFVNDISCLGSVELIPRSYEKPGELVTATREAKIPSSKPANIGCANTIHMAVSRAH